MCAFIRTVRSTLIQLQSRSDSHDPLSNLRPHLSVKRSQVKASWEPILEFNGRQRTGPGCPGRFTSEQESKVAPAPLASRPHSTMIEVPLSRHQEEPQNIKNKQGVGLK
jgi:hypothetical protein